VPDLSGRILAAAGVPAAGAGAGAGAGAAGGAGAAAGGDAGGSAGAAGAGGVAVASARRRGWPMTMLRVALAAVAVGQAIVAWPALALGADTMEAPTHVAHESGAWNVALAVALLAVARRPRYSVGLLPLLAAFVAVLAVVSLPDLAAGHVPGGRLASHLLLVGALALVAALARQLRSETPPLGGRGQTVPEWAAAGADPGYGADPGSGGASVGPRRQPAVGESRPPEPFGVDQPGHPPARRVVA
jgi:hypothetical protein